MLSAALRGEPTGQSRVFRGDAVAVAKRDLAPGDMLDGEGGYTVWGKLIPARLSLEKKALPIGLAHGIKVTRAVKAGSVLAQNDVEALLDGQVMKLRREAVALVG